MKRYLFDNFSLFTFFSIIILYFSLLIGFYYNENSTGGALIDYFGHKQISISFSIDFLNTFLILRLFLQSWKISQYLLK